MLGASVFVGLLISLTFLTTLSTSDEKKWVWEDNSRQGKLIQERYEVFEDDPNDHYASSDNYHNHYNRPYHQSQQLFTPNAHGRPGGVYGDGAHPTSGYGQAPGILTGPVPSWVKEYPVKDFDRCKCTEKFNCPSPGISYGHCDVGKRYCCFVTSPQKAVGHPLPPRPHHSPENGVLSGPGGPIDYRPNHYNPRPTHGVLTGPGGAYRPYQGRPGYANGVLAGQGGSYDPYTTYNVYERQARKKD